MTSSTSVPANSPETPFAVRDMGQMMGNWIAKLGMAWVEGQIAQAKVVRGMAYITLRDTDIEQSLSLAMPASAFEQVTPKVEQGARVVVQIKPEWWAKNGSVSFRVHQMRAVGVGELMARLEALRHLLTAEGLFNPARKVPLPFLPRRIGLICGVNADAKHDVIQNATRRWPTAEFVIREVPVSGVGTVAKVSAALTELDAIDDVDVIVVTRGGGSFEDLLPFSDEALIRAAAKIVTPIVSAIGHEQDKPLLDDVADFRASTPTDAAKNIVPDLATELGWLRDSRAHNRLIVTQRIDRLTHELEIVRNRPALAAPAQLIDERITDVKRLKEHMRKIVVNKVEVETARLAGQITTLRALSPQSALDRGYSIVREGDSVIRSAHDLRPGQTLQVTFAHDQADITIAEITQR